MKEARITIYEILKILTIKHALEQILPILHESHHFIIRECFFLLYCEDFKISIMFSLILKK